MKTFKLLLFLLLLPSVGWSFGVTWEGFLTQPDGVTPDSNATRAINIKLYDNDKSCLIYEEDHIVDTATSLGQVAIEVGTGTAANGAMTETYFDNTVLQTCYGATTETLGLFEDRKLEITVGGELMSPDVTVSLLPSAVYAKQAAVAQALNPDAVVTASITAQSITDEKMAGIASPCSLNEVLKSDGSGGFSCAPDDDTYTKNTIDDVAADGVLANSISSNWAFDHDANVSAHHVATVDTSAATICSAGQYLDGDGTCNATPAADNLGTHTATQNLVMGTFNITGVTNINGTAAAELANVATNAGDIVTNATAISANTTSIGTK
jgi:hypothetical protein